MTTRADTIARHINATTLCEADKRLLYLAFLETLGGAAVAGEAAGPWVVRLPGGRWWDGLNHREHLADAVRFRDQRVAYQWAVDGATVLPLAEAERMEAAATLASLPAHTQKVLAELADEEPSAEVLAADDGPDPTPEPPKPAGWVVRHSGGVVRWLCIRTREGGWPKHEPFATREDAQRIADTTGGAVLPVDAAGNVIEADVIEAEDIGATLRREECERKAARQSGVAWEAARAGEEAERLRTELAAVKAERDKVLSNAAVLDTSLRRLRTDHATTLAERDKWAANAGTLNASLRQVHTECDQLRAELDATLAERDALAAEVQRAREQKPVRWAVVLTTGHVASVWHEPDIAAEVAATVAGRRVAPLYLAPVAPVVRDHSGVIAQCEEALALHVRLGCGDGPDAYALRAALAALRGAS